MSKNAQNVEISDVVAPQSGGVVSDWFPAQVVLDITFHIETGSRF